jgi:hypothetical protein
MGLQDTLSSPWNQYKKRDQNDQEKKAKFEAFKKLNTNVVWHLSLVLLSRTVPDQLRWVIISFTLPNHVTKPPVDQYVAVVSSSSEGLFLSEHMHLCLDVVDICTNVTCSATIMLTHLSFISVLGWAKLYGCANDLWCVIA